MNQKLTVLLIAITLLCAGCSQKDRASYSKKDLANSVFVSLKSNDFKAYERRFSNNEDVQYHFHNLIAYSNKRIKDEAKRKKLQAKVNRMLKKFPARRAKRVIRLKVGFSGIREKLNSHNVDWSRLSLSGIHVERASTMYDMPIADIILNLTDQNKVFVIRLPLCIKVRRGWIFSEGMRWEGVSKTLPKKKTVKSTTSSRQ